MLDKQEIKNQNFDAERALYGLHGAEVKSCTFAGPADGESALKETGDIRVVDCHFELRYPLWHVQGFALENSDMTETARAALWYAENGEIKNCRLGGIKALRECQRVNLSGVEAVSEEFGWKCRDIQVTDSDITSSYVFLDSRDLTLTDSKIKSKYSFQYVENTEIEHCELDTKDAFWHSRNVTVRNSIIKGEYLGWYSENLTLINCRIIGTQPLCYCKGLKLVDCTMEGCDLSFERSEVEAEVRGSVDSIKNPVSGRITADSVGEIIREESVPQTAEIIIRDEQERLGA